MIGPGPGARVMVATRPVDFRKGPDALAALALTGGSTRSSHCEPRSPARVYEQASQFSADDILQHLLVERQVRHQLAKL